MHLLTKQFLRMVLVAAAAPMLAACASGPTYETTPPPALSSDLGRIMIYRDQEVGMGIQPSVLVNGVAVGSAVPDGYFYLDRPAGDYKISSSTEVERELSVTLAAGQIRYVRLEVSMGILAAHISPVLTDEAAAMRELPKLHFTNGPPPKEKVKK